MYVPRPSELFRTYWPNLLIAAGNYKSNMARVAIESGTVDAIAFSRYFISNPDLPEKLHADVA